MPSVPWHAHSAGSKFAFGNAAQACKKTNDNFVGECEKCHCFQSNWSIKKVESKHSFLAAYSESRAFCNT